MEEKEMDGINYKKSYPPGSLVYFYDKKNKIPPDKETGTNQVGIFITGNKILFCRKRNLVEVDAKSLTGKKATVYPAKNEEYIEKLVRYLDHVKIIIGSSNWVLKPFQ